MKTILLSIALLASASSVSAALGNRQCFLNNVPGLLGYNCCKRTCFMQYKDDDGNWGLEDGVWCGIPFACYNGCWSMPDFPCCQYTNEVYYTDSAGNQWGVENNDWCGIMSQPQVQPPPKSLPSVPVVPQPIQPVQPVQPVVTTTTTPTPTPTPVDKCNWEETFESLDETRWNLNSGGECIKVGGGKFVDSVSQSCRGSGNGGRMRTNVRYTSGKFEVRAKMPIASGLVPAIYFASTPNNQNGDQDEFDFELIGSNRMQTNLFIHGGGGREEVWNPPVDLSQDFHLYTFEWSSSALVLKVDNQVIRTFNNPLPQQPSYLILTNWMCVGCDGWTGPADWSRQPYEFIVDYVKITDAKCM
jgi:Beta-glucanase/Beta-glucan synthetase